MSNELELFWRPLLLENWVICCMLQMVLLDQGQLRLYRTIVMWKSVCLQKWEETFMSQNVNTQTFSFVC